MSAQRGRGQAGVGLRVPSVVLGLLLLLLLEMCLLEVRERGRHARGAITVDRRRHRCYEARDVSLREGGEEVERSMRM